jgi:hypothetical protein
MVALNLGGLCGGERTGTWNASKLEVIAKR